MLLLPALNVPGKMLVGGIRAVAGGENELVLRLLVGKRLVNLVIDQEYDI
jgi:hypothetical protein